MTTEALDSPHHDGLLATDIKVVPGVKVFIEPQIFVPDDNVDAGHTEVVENLLGNVKCI